MYMYVRTKYDIVLNKYGATGIKVQSPQLRKVRFGTYSDLALSDFMAAHCALQVDVDNAVHSVTTDTHATYTMYFLTIVRQYYCLFILNNG